MKIFKSINKFNKEVNFKANIGFVPTMGSLHKGHISLIESSIKKCNKTIVSIFVNPTQFNNKTDYKNYPRNIFYDIKILKKLKVDYLLLPNVKNIYIKKSKKKIKLLKKDKILCAKFRKGHFEGVLAVINRLLKIVKSNYIFLGQKDYQQVILIKNFIKKRFKTRVIAIPTVRQKDYLAYSSRNSLLNKKDLLIASKIAKKLYFYYLKIKKNFSKKEINIIIKDIKTLGIKLEYLEIRNKYNLSTKTNKNNFKIFIAYYIKGIRLIDNF